MLIEELAGTLGAVGLGIVIAYSLATPLGWFVIIPATAGGIVGKMLSKWIAN